MSFADSKPNGGASHGCETSAKHYLRLGFNRVVANSKALAPALSANGEVDSNPGAWVQEPGSDQRFGHLGLATWHGVIVPGVDNGPAGAGRRSKYGDITTRVEWREYQAEEIC